MQHWFRTGKKIIGIGRNFADHAKELGNKVPSELIVFLKPTTSYLRPGNDIVVPIGAEVHHEVELGVVIGVGGKHILREDALKHVAGYCVSLDLTARNWQIANKNAGLPWATAKGADTFCPVGDFVPSSEIKDPSNVDLWLTVNGETRQEGNTCDMIWDVPHLIEEVSKIFTLEQGDFILTGTPKGVGPLERGDVVQIGMQDMQPFTWTVTTE